MQSCLDSRQPPREVQFQRHGISERAPQRWPSPAQPEYPAQSAPTERSRSSELASAPCRPALTRLGEARGWWAESLSHALRPSGPDAYRKPLRYARQPVQSWSAAELGRPGKMQAPPEPKETEIKMLRMKL